MRTDRNTSQAQVQLFFTISPVKDLYQWPGSLAAPLFRAISKPEIGRVLATLSGWQGTIRQGLD